MASTYVCEGYSTVEVHQGVTPAWNSGEFEGHEN